MLGWNILLSLWSWPQDLPAPDPGGLRPTDRGTAAVVERAGAARVDGGLADDLPTDLRCAGGMMVG